MPHKLLVSVLFNIYAAVIYLFVATFIFSGFQTIPFRSEAWEIVSIRTNSEAQRYDDAGKRQ